MKTLIFSSLLAFAPSAQAQFHYYNNVPWGHYSYPGGTFHYYETPWGGFGSSYDQGGSHQYYWYNNPWGTSWSIYGSEDDDP